jgi:hypothetical protein
MNKRNVIIGIVALLVSFGAGYFATPTKIKTETKEVVKTVKEEAKTKTVYKERIIYKDGTIVEHEGSKEETNTKESNESSKNSSSSSTKDAGLTLSALAIVDSSDINGHRDYGIHVAKRVFSNITVGAMATTDKKIGVSVGVAF